MSLITNINRKSLIIRESGRSTDYITPSFGYGCLLNCSYCYMKRHLANGLSIAKNVGEILTTINNHATWLPEKTPNQTDSKYWTYDISCNEDFALHSKYHNWQHIFDFFRDNDKIKGSFATKIVPTNFLSYTSNNKIRIRFSLMPQSIASIVEPNTAKIIDRIKAINIFIEAGYEVHVNFSPIILYKGWLQDYKELFILLNSNIKNAYKESVKAEVIFLTHNINKHLYNIKHDISGEFLLWQPNLQESKVSQFGGSNLRYKKELKEQYINQFKELHNSIISWNTIRYIF